MRKFTFVCQEHEEYGGLGWKPTWFIVGDPLGGIGVAHDVIEHLHAHDGTVADEMLATGACMYVRGETGEFSRGSYYSRWCDQVYSEIAEMLNKHVWGDGTAGWVPLQTRRSTRLYDYIEDEFDTAITRIRRAFLEDYEGSQEDLNRYFCPLRQKALKALWRKGYRRAQRAYGDQYTAASAFRDIAALADKHLKNADEGDTMTIRLTRRTVEYSVRFG